jgi:hypothetical protein
VILDRVDDFGIGDGREVRPIFFAEHEAQVSRHDGARGFTVAHHQFVAEDGAIADQHRIDQFLLAQGRIQMRAIDAKCCVEARHMRAMDVVLDVRVADACQQLRVRFERVVGFDERLQGCLPIAGQLLRHVEIDVALGEVPVGEMLAHRRHIVGKRLCLLVRVQEDETAPRLHPHFGQVEPFGRHMRKVPRARHPL